jgi:simple sugar transport system permease protein
MLDAVVISLVAMVISLALFGVFVACSGANPLDVYQVMFEGSFGSGYSWGKTLLQAAPLMLTALCVLLPSRVGMVIIGGEGCVVLGGLMAALVAQIMPHGGHYLLLTCMMVAGMATGGLWIMFAGALRLFRGVNEVISSLLLNYIAIKILNHCVEGPMHDPEMLDAPSSFAVSGNSQMPTIMGKIPWTDIHWGLVFGVIACILTWVLLERTTHGFATRIVGGNVRAARIAGLSVAKFSLIACFLGGAAAALAGVVEVAAVQGRANEGGLATNLGYTGILVAFVSRQNPLAVIPVAILMGGVVASGHDLKMHSELHIGDASVQVFTGILFLVILGLDTWAGRLSDVKNAWFARPITRLFNRKQGVVHAGANA